MASLSAMTTDTAAVLIAICAALSFGTCEALQLREAVQIPESEALRPGLLLQLMRRGMWLLGIVTDIGGFVLMGVALALGPLVLVYPVVTLQLLWTFLLLTRWYHQSLRAEQWASIVAVVAGAALFVAATGKGGTAATAVPGGDWIAFWVAGGGALALLGASALAVRDRSRALRIAFAAGVADALLATALAALSGSSGGVGHALVSWPLYVVIGAGIVDLLFKQTAYQAGYPTMTLPIMAVTDPLLVVLIGAVLFNEQAWANGPWIAPSLVGLASMSVGLVVLGREPRLAHRGPEPLTELD